VNDKIRLEMLTTSTE